MEIQVEYMISNVSALTHKILDSLVTNDSS